MAGAAGTLPSPPRAPYRDEQLHELPLEGVLIRPTPNLKRDDPTLSADVSSAPESKIWSSLIRPHPIAKEDRDAGGRIGPGSPADHFVLPRLWSFWILSRRRLVILALEPVRDPLALRPCHIVQAESVRRELGHGTGAACARSSLHDY